MPPGLYVCSYLDQKRISLWKVLPTGKWETIEVYSNLKDFEKDKGKFEEWQPVKLVGGESINHCYKETKYTDTAYIVTPTTKYEKYKEHKPKVFDNYYIKDIYKKINDRLPELKGLF